MKMIMKSLVGSRAHGLHREDSDWDWRGVYVEPTSKILELGYKYSGTQWLEGVEDHTNYEIGHYLMLATKANPSVLELLVSPKISFGVENSWGIQLKGLMPQLFTPRDAYNAFTGYSHNQRKKFLEDKDGRRLKFALAYIRTLMNLNTFLETGMFSLKVNPESPQFETLCNIRDDKMGDGAIIDLAKMLEQSAALRLSSVPNNQNLDAVNKFLIGVRKANW